MWDVGIGCLETIKTKSRKGYHQYRCPAFKLNHRYYLSKNISANNTRLPERRPQTTAQQRVPTRLSPSMFCLAKVFI